MQGMDNEFEKMLINYTSVKILGENPNEMLRVSLQKKNHRSTSFLQFTSW